MRVAISSISFCEYIIQQANALASLGHSVLLIMPSPLPKDTVGEDFARLLAVGVQSVTYEVVGKWRPGFYYSLVQAVARFSPDVLHIHENGEIETLALISRFRRTPLVVTVHDIVTHPGADSQIALRRRWIKKFLRRKSNIIHVHGLFLRKLLEKNNPILAAKCMVVPHGTLSLFRQLESGHVVREPLKCLFFGRMEKYRGLDNLVRIGRILKQRLSGIRIVVAGTGTELAKYKSELIATGIFEIHDSFIPDREIYRFFKRSSLLLLPYNEASQSGVIMMGLSFGLPVVATKVGAIPEIIVDGQHGRVLPVGDFYGFAEAVHQMLTNEVVRQKMANACIKLGEALSFQNLAGRFESMYAQVVTAIPKK